MTPPNIIYIHSHDMGRYVQPYGHAIATPNIQRLAEEGVTFRQAFSVAPTCSPSRAGLVTGQCAHSAGMLGLALKGRNFNIADCGQHILHTLKKAGYTSALIGVQHIALDVQTIGYDQVLEPTGWPAAEKAAESAVEFLRKAHEAPFFLSVGTMETHRHNFQGAHFHQEGPQGDPRYCAVAAPLPDTPQTRLDMADYIESAGRFDAAVGQVLDALDETGLSENTLVICTTDHGLAFPGMKCTLSDHGTGVMLILRGPGGFSGGRVIDAMVSQMDLFPTVCDLSDVKKPDWLQGRSLLPLIREEVAELHEELFAEVNYHAAYEPMRSVRTSRWKYIRRFDRRRRPVLPHCDPGPSKDLWLEHGWRDRSIDGEQLFDLMFDPQEACNQADNPASQDILQEMRGRLERWMRDTHDPLLVGPVPAPPEAGVNDPDGIHHTEPLIPAGTL